MLRHQVSPQQGPSDRDCNPLLLDRLRKAKPLTQSHVVHDTAWPRALCVPCLLLCARYRWPLTFALLPAIEAMKKAYQEELSRELNKTRSLQQGPDGLRKQHQ